jgi:hypothetical protein
MAIEVVTAGFPVAESDVEGSCPRVCIVNAQAALVVAALGVRGPPQR